MPRGSAAIRVLLIAMLALPLSARAHGQLGVAPDLTEVSVLQLRRAANRQADGSHLARLFALRQLHDPAMAPLLSRVSRAGTWQVQVHAILGLAEIAPDRALDPWLVNQVDPDARAALIANALDMDLIEEKQIRELLELDGLHPMSRLLLIGELIAAGAPVDRAEVRRLAANGEVRTTGLASLLLAQLGDPSGLSAQRDRIADLARRERNAHLLWLLEVVRQYRLTATWGWTAELLELERLSDEVRYWTVFTLLVLDPESGLPCWERALGPEPSYRDRVRYGMLLLAAGPEIPKKAYGLIAGEDELTQAMARAGRTVSADRDAAPALIALLDLGHPRTAQWVMDTLEKLPAPQATTVYLHLIDVAEGDEAGRAERVARAITATALLYEIDEDRVLELLSAAQDDSLAQEIILLGLFETNSARAAAAARSLRRIGAGRADSLALLLIARHAETLEGADLEMLGRIAAGGGRLSTGLQTQAAWLYLKHTGQLERAIPLIFDEDA